MADGKGMNAKKLSARSRQPGHDRTFKVSENNFVAAPQAILPPDRYLVVDHPGDLRSIFTDDAGSLGVVPETSISSAVSTLSASVVIQQSANTLE